ncbi:MAG: peptide deformylase [Cyanobacteria bacterium P01_G01_bin.19]
MTKIAQIATLGEPILRKQAQTIATPLSADILELIKILTNTAIARNGVGIAAPQISQSYRLFIISSHPSDRYPHAPKMSPTAMIDPRILSHSQEVVKDWEGCLSVPNVRGLVPRYKEIEVEYLTQEGVLKRQVLTDFIARIFQHELDHLDGILFIDRIEDKADLYTEAEYQQIIKH